MRNKKTKNKTTTNDETEETHLVNEIKREISSRARVRVDRAKLLFSAFNEKIMSGKFNTLCAVKDCTQSLIEYV